MSAKARRPTAWLLIGTVVLGLVAAAIIVWPRLARKRFFDELESAGARVSYLSGGPDWLRRFTGEQPTAILDDLWALDLSRTEIDRAALENAIGHLRACRHVGSINFAGAPLIDTDLEALRQMPALYELDLSGTRVSDAGLRHLRDCGNLRTLILSGTRVSDAGLAHLRALPRLEVLILDGTEVTNSGMELLAELPRLRTVSLSNTAVTDEGVHALSRGVPELAVSDD